MPKFLAVLLGVALITGEVTEPVAAFAQDVPAGVERTTLKVQIVPLIFHLAR